MEKVPRTLSPGDTAPETPPTAVWVGKLTESVNQDTIWVTLVSDDPEEVEEDVEFKRHEFPDDIWSAIAAGHVFKYSFWDDSASNGQGLLAQYEIIYRSEPTNEDLERAEMMRAVFRKLVKPEQ